MTFKIKEARQIAGITQKELAKRIGVSAGTLSDYENGNHDPKSDCLSKIADTCGVTVDFLLGREKAKAPTPSGEDAGALSKADAESALVSLGIVQDGQHISDADLRFMDGVINLIDVWFQNRHQ